MAVFGLGGSGIMAAQALVAGGADVVCWDDGERGRKRAEDAGLNVQDLTAFDWSRVSALVLAPGVPLTHPEPHWSVKAAAAAGVEIIGDVELFARQRALSAPKAPMIAITGTNGKSTTTALISHVLRTLGLDVQMGGNIGKAILSLEPPSEERIHVIEMSSYQIDLAPTMQATVGVLLNITPDHLERHGTLAHYAEIKSRLVHAADAACISIDNALTKDIAERVAPPVKLYAFTRGKGAAFVPRVYAIGTTLFVHDTKKGHAESRKIASLDDIATLRGEHNTENALATVAALRALAEQVALHDAGLAARIWQPERIADGLRSFSGLAHRLQPVARLGTTVFVNDSKATNAESAEKALASFPGDIYWIVGGRAKEGGIDTLAPFFERIRKAYLIGEAAGPFAETLEGKVETLQAGTVDAAVTRAANDAARDGAPHPIVLLSPACASFDQYPNFERRGEHFCEVVAALDGIEIFEGLQ